MSSKRISMHDARIGMYLCGIDRPWLETPFLSHRFLIKSSKQIEKLQQCGVQHIDIDPDRGLDVSEEHATNQERSLSPSQPSDSLDTQALSMPEWASSPEERLTKLDPMLRGKSLTNELVSMRKTREVMLSSVQDILEGIRTSGTVQGQKVKEVAVSIIAQTIGHEDACLSLIRTREFSPELFDHSVSVGTLAVLFARLLGYDEDQLHILATAALLHDIGLLKLPKSILQVKKGMSDADLALFQSHPALGMELLKNSPGIPPEVLQMVFDHHVTLDGQGFPSEVVPSNITSSTKILTLMDEYDELLTGQQGGQPLTIKESLRELYQRGQRNRLDQQLVEQFINQVGIYPLYSLVELNSGERGIVTANSPGNLLQPTILLIQDAERRLFEEPIPLCLTLTAASSSEPQINKVLDPEREGIQVDKVLAEWVTL